MRPMRLFLRNLSNSLREADVTVGTTADGGAQAGTGVAIVGGAAWAGVVRSGGTGGDGQAGGQCLVRRSRVGRECNVRNHFLLLLRGDDVFALAANWLAISPRPQDGVIRARS